VTQHQKIPQNKFTDSLLHCQIVFWSPSGETSGGGGGNRCSTQTERPSVETAEATQQETERGYFFKYSPLLADVYSAKLHRCRYKPVGSGFGFGRAKGFLKQTWDSFNSGIEEVGFKVVVVVLLRNFVFSVWFGFWFCLIAFLVHWTGWGARGGRRIRLLCESSVFCVVLEQEGRGGWSTWCHTCHTHQGRGKWGTRYPRVRRMDMSSWIRLCLCSNMPTSRTKLCSSGWITMLWRKVNHKWLCPHRTLFWYMYV
jgi:hypothetical protein